MEGQVQPQKVLESFVLPSAFAEHSSEIVAPVLVDVNFSREGTTTTIGVLVDLCCHCWQLREKVDAVIESRFPVISLVQAALVRLGEDGGVIQRRYSASELGHRMQVLGKVVEHAVDELWQLRLLGKLARKSSNLGRRWDLSGQQQPEHGFREHFGSRRSLGQLILAIFDGSAMEANALIGIQDRTFPDHAFETPTR